MMPGPFLIIQPAFIGDAILVSSLVETLNKEFNGNVEIDLLLRKGNESLYTAHPFLNELLVWDKGSGKYTELLRMSRQIRKKKYQAVINPHRYTTSGYLTWRARADKKIGFSKNPMSWSFSESHPHPMEGEHEIHRNYSLLKSLVNVPVQKPRLYPTPSDVEAVRHLKNEPYICIAPTSVWYTKQWPAHKWISLLNAMKDKRAYLLGAPSDRAQCEAIAKGCEHVKLVNLAGDLSLLQSASLMADAQMNYVNDSAPLHLASSMNAPVRALFNSTVSKFGFTPLSDDSKVIESELDLDCRPCGIHGHQACPKGHFNCAESISIERLLS